MIEFFDAHTHAHFAAFKDDYREVIRKALESGVGLVNVGTQKDTSSSAVSVAHEFNEYPVYAAVGLHPVHTSKSFHDEDELGGGLPAKGFMSRAEEFDYDYYRNLALDPKTVAIGECGLDYYRLEEGYEKILKEKQIKAFKEQMKLAYDVGKPLMIHCRNAFGDLIEILDVNYKILNTNNPGIIHFFSGTKEEAKKLLDLGFSFTFGGVITFARNYDEVIKFLPGDRILSETDAPYVAPLPYRGKRNEPSYVREVATKLSEIRGVSLDEMANSIRKNARRIFKIA